MKEAPFAFRQKRLTYFHSGQGPAVVLLHGFLEHSAMWAKVWPHLPKGYTYLLLDLPGHGRSENLDSTHSMELMAETVQALLTHTKQEGALLWGHSLGGYVALAFAERYPERLRGILLQNSTAGADSPERRQGRDASLKLAERHCTSYIRHAIPLHFTAFAKPSLGAAIAEAIAQGLSTSPDGVLAALRGMKIRADRQHIWREIQVPKLLFAGKNDPLIPFAVSAKQGAMAGVQWCPSEGGHMAHYEDRERLIACARTFISEVYA